MNQDPREDRHIERLLERAPPRTRPPETTRRAVRERLYRQWRARLARRRRAQVSRWALAAGVVLAAGIVLWWPRPGVEAPTAAPQATVTQVVGEARVQGGTQRRIEVNDHWLPGEVVETGPGALIALRGPHGEHLRLDQLSQLEWVAADRIRLLAGRLYVDTAGHGRALAVLVGEARVQHLGTQYLVAHDDSGVQVAVRSGRVAVVRDNQESVAGRGEALRLDPSGTLRRERLAPYGDAWRWADAMAPGFELDGQSVRAFVEWVAHETGRELRYANGHARTVAERAQLRGQVTGAPADAMRVVLAASDLEAHVEEGLITVSLRSNG